MKAGGPDIKQLRERDLPQGRFPGDASLDFRVFIDPKAHEQIHKHANENVGVEICGVMVGRWGKDDKGPFLTVSASIRGESATNKFAEVTFTHDTWSKINATMDKEYAAESIVGWYHTHPDFGIFLSDRDRFIHEHFFSEPGQVALVVDPVRKQEGVFIWQDGRAMPSPYYWVGEKLTLSKASDDGEMREEKRGGGRSESSSSSQEQHVPVLDRPWMGNMTMILAAILMLMLGWMLHERLSSSAAEAFVQMIQYERLRLNLDLGQMKNSLLDALTPLDAAMQRNPEVFRTPEMQATARNLGNFVHDLEALQRRYAINEQELAQIATQITAQLNRINEMRRRDNPTTQSTTAPGPLDVPAPAPAPAPTPTPAPPATGPTR